MSSSTKSRPGSKGDEVRAFPREGEAGAERQGSALGRGWGVSETGRGKAGETREVAPGSLQIPSGENPREAQGPELPAGNQKPGHLQGAGPQPVPPVFSQPLPPRARAPPPGAGGGNPRGFQAPQREGRGIRAASPGFHLPRRLGGQRRGWRPIKSRNSGVRNREPGQRPPVSARA